jgi:hypothetical protein
VVPHFYMFGSGVKHEVFGSTNVKDWLGNQSGGSDWEPIKIPSRMGWLLKQDELCWTPKITCSALNLLFAKTT